MVICKYFLRGSCRFGESCKNEHAYNESTAASVMRKKGEIDINVLIKSVSNDMDKAEKGNQWPLSCYGPFQARPCFPGFEDKCFEEIRLGIYEAEKSGTVEQYKQQLTQLLHEARIKMRSLQNPTAEASHVLQELYNANTPDQQTSNVFANTNTFNNSPIQSNSVFNNSGAAGKSIFNNQTGQNFTFAVPENKSIFGNTASNTNIFAQANQQNFATTGGGIFNSNQPQQNQSFQGTNIFKNANTSIFGGNQTTTNQFNATQPAQQPNIFMQNNQPQPPNPFKQNIQAPAPGQSPFGPVAVQQSPFAVSNTSNFPPNLNQPQQTFPNQMTPFAPQSATTGAFAQNTTPFAATQPTNQSIFAQNQPSFAVNQSPFAATVPSTVNQSPFTATVPSTVNQSPFAATVPPTVNQPSFVSSTTTPGQAPFGASPFAPQVGLVTDNRSIFAQSSQINASDHSKSIFGSSQSTIIAAPVARQDDPTIYSRLETLTENDVRSFDASTFEFGKIPDKPPTLQMCS